MFRELASEYSAQRRESRRGSIIHGRSCSAVLLSAVRINLHLHCCRCRFHAGHDRG